MVDRQTEGIAHSTSLIQTSVDRVKAGLTDFAGDARDNGGQLIKAQKRLSHLEMLSNNMLDTLANSGAEIDDTPMILLAQERAREIAALIERAIAEGRIIARGRVRHRLCPDRRHQPAAIFDALLRFCRRSCPAGPGSDHGGREPGDRGGAQRRQRLFADAHQRALASRSPTIRNGTPRIAATGATWSTRPRSAQFEAKIR